MQEEYEDSVEGIQEKAKNAGEALKMSLFNSNDLKGYYKSLEKITKFFDNIVNTVGGLPGILGLVATALLNVY